MKEAIGGISLFQIVILFVLLFTGIMCLTINHSKAFSVKDELINIIQNEDLNNTGLNYALSENTRENIANLLAESGYRITGNCPDDSWLGYNREGEEVGSKNASFCIKANNVSNSFTKDLQEKCKCTITSGDYPDMVYYDIVLFYQLDIPVIRYLMQLELKGSTKVLFG